MARVSSTSDSPLPPGMHTLHVGAPLVGTTLQEIARLGSKKVFVMANRSSVQFASPLMDALEKEGILAAPLCCDVGMGGGEAGLLQACDKAALSKADAVVTIGGGAIQDAGKLLRLWLSTTDGHAPSSVEGICAAAHGKPLLVPQVSCPNSFAMAELTSIAGITTKDQKKTGASNPAMMPSVCIFDPALTQGLPDWVRFGTALRGVEHCIGAMCSPKANSEIRQMALEGAVMIKRGLQSMMRDPLSVEAAVDCYRGGSYAIRALSSCYPAVAHYIENQYSARFDVHQGSCSGILCARILDYHADSTAEHQNCIAEVFGREGESGTSAIKTLVAALPGVSKDHDPSITEAQLLNFSEHLFSNLDTLNSLSPKPFSSLEDIHSMLTKPLSAL